jgi:hypothetical protein
MNGRNQWNVTVVMFIDVSCQLHRLVGALEAGKASTMPAEFNYSSRFKVGFALPSCFYIQKSRD